MNLEMTIDIATVSANIEELTPKALKALEVVGQTTGAKMKSYAQNNAKWTDRTNAARGGLDFNSRWEGTVLTISIMHTVDYGLWLEIRDFPHAGRLAILEEARDSQVQSFLNMVKKILG